MQGSEIAHIRRISGPARASSQALDLALSRAFMALDNGSIPSSALPSGARIALRTRAETLDECLAPATEEEVLLVLASIAHMPSKTEADPAKSKFQIAIETQDLREFPAWALQAAAKAYRAGEVSDGHWRPTAGELAIYARGKVHADRRERGRIAAVLAAKAADPEALKSDAEARKATVAAWRAKQVRAADPSAFSLREMDARHCKGDIRREVVAAHESHVQRLAEQFRLTPPSPLSAYADTQMKEGMTNG